MKGTHRIQYIYETSKRYDVEESIEYYKKIFKELYENKISIDSLSEEELDHFLAGQINAIGQLSIKEYE